MKINSILSFYFLFIGSLFAQSKVDITGKIVDSEGAAVFAANVYCKSNPTKGTISDLDGSFALNAPTTNDTLMVSYIGYATLEIPLVDLERYQDVVLQLDAAAEEFNTIIVTGKDPISEQYAVTKLEKLEIYLNPAAQGDPLKAITTLGASTTADESANPSLRGSSEDRSRVILNGVPIYRPVRNSQLNGIGNFSIFNTELVDQMYVYASNPPLTYGNSSAGLVEIQTTESLDANELQISATLASVGLMASRELNDKAFVQAFSNVQFADAFLALNGKSLDRLNEFRTTDGGLHFYYSISPKLSFKSLTYAIDESYDYQLQLFTYEGPSKAGKRRLFSVNSLQLSLPKGILSVHSGFDRSNTNFSFGNLSSDQITRQLYNSLNYKHLPDKGFSFQVGLTHDYQQHRFDDQSPSYYFALAPESPSTLGNTNIQNHILEGYAYGTWDINQDWKLSGGIRSNWPILEQEAYTSAQIGIHFQASPEQSWLLSAGQYYSYTTPSFNLQEFALLSSRQVALDYSYSKKSTKLKAAVFYKQESGAQLLTSFILGNASRIMGFECSIEQELGKYWQFTLANTILDHRVELDQTTFMGQFDFNYFAKASLSFQHPRLPALSLVYLGRPGSPYTPIIGANWNPDAGFFEPRFGNSLNDQRFGNYNRLDFSLSKYFPFSSGSLITFLNIANILNQKNEANDLYNSDYSQQFFDYYTQRTIFFGVVWQWKY